MGYIPNSFISKGFGFLVDPHPVVLEVDSLRSDVTEVFLGENAGTEGSLEIS